MRYFAATPEIFDALRASVMQMLGQPNGRADEPWGSGVSVLALAPHEYEPPEYAAIIQSALAMGGSEITEDEYRAALGQTPLPIENA